MGVRTGTALASRSLVAARTRRSRRAACARARPGRSGYPAPTGPPGCTTAASRRSGTRAARRPGPRRPGRPSPTRTGRRCARRRRPRRRSPRPPWPRPSRAGTSSAPSSLGQPLHELGRPGAADHEPERAGPRRCGTAGAAGSAVLRTWPWAGSATAPAVSSPRSHSATCTAQSVRPGSPNSLVPSSGSTIQTRLADSRAGSSAPSSDSTASPGRSRGQLGGQELVRAAGHPRGAAHPGRRRAARSASSRRAGLARPGQRPGGRHRWSSIVSRALDSFHPQVPPEYVGSPGRMTSGSHRAGSARYGTRSARRPGPAAAGSRPHRRTVRAPGQQLPLGGGKVAQHEVRGVHPARRTADSDPRPQVVTGAEGGGHRPQAVVAVVSAAQLQPDRAEREVQLVMDDDDPLRRDLVEGTAAPPRGRRTGS